MANRYSNVSVSQFDPLSLEEILAVPLYKQKQYDALEEARIKQADMFKVDPLDVHKEEAQKLNNEYMSKVDELANYQARTGDIQGSKNKLLQLQRDYKNLTDPMGKVAQINTATQNEAAAYKQWMSSDEAKKYGPDIANKRWLEHRQSYKGYDDKGNIINISQMQAPAYQDLNADIKDLKGMIGSTELTKAINNGFDIKYQPDGSAIVMDGSGNVIEKTNNAQLINAYNYLKEKWLTPNGEGYKSAIFAGQTPQSIFNKLNYGVGMMKEYSLKDTRNNDYSLQGYRNANEVKEAGGAGTIINNNSTLTSDTLEFNTYSDALNARKKLSTSNSPADRAKLSDLVELQRVADSKLAANPNYNKLQNQFLAKQKEIDDYKKKYFESKNGKLTRKANASGNFVEIKLNNLQNDLKDISNKRAKYKDDAWKDSSSMRHDYSYMPTTSKEKTEWDIYNENVLTTLQGTNLANLLDLTGIHTTGGSTKNIQVEDVNNVQELLNSANPKSFKINNIKTFGKNTTPEITMTFTGTKGSKTYDTKGVAWNDEYGGEDKPVTVTFKMKDFSNAVKTGSAPGFKSLSGAIAQFWRDKGGINQVTGSPQGMEVYDSFIENQYKGYDNKTLEAMSHVDADAKRAFDIRYIRYQNSKK